MVSVCELIGAFMMVQFDFNHGMKVWSPQFLDFTTCPAQHSAVLPHNGVGCAAECRFVERTKGASPLLSPHVR